ncbi:MAG TPA: NlpC/P60 family protein [Armatimonadota bacterium]|jgi:cell wall-associated NlpC family hydrolase
MLLTGIFCALLFASAVGAESTYTIKRGDMLPQIASRFSITLDDLCTLNKIYNPDVLYVGQVLRLPENAVIPVEPAAPVAQKAPAVSPAPVAPKVPVAPVTPSTPVVQTPPAVQVAPVTPTTPAAPVTPQAPVVAMVPATPVTPVVPKAPAAPVVPVAPKAPKVPATPVAPKAPAVTEAPAVPVAPVAPKVPKVPAVTKAPKVPKAPVTLRTPQAPVQPEAAPIIAKEPQSETRTDGNVTLTGRELLAKRQQIPIDRYQIVSTDPSQPTLIERVLSINEAPVKSPVMARPPSRTVVQPAAPAPAPRQQPAAQPQENSRAGIVSTARNYLGAPYSRGGLSYRGIDCSGLVVRAMATLNRRVPHHAATLYHMGTKVVYDDLEPGDLLFFNTLGSGVSHVGIWIGENKFIHASCSRGVTVSELKGYYSRRLVGARRIR